MKREDQSALAFLAYLYRSAAFLLASDDLDTRAKGLRLLHTLLFDPRYQ